MSVRRLARALLVAALAFAVAVVVAGAWAWSALHRSYAGWSGPSVDVTIDPGLGAAGVLRRLNEAGVVRHPRLARGWLAWHEKAGRLQAGEYRFERAASAVQVLRRLERGDVLLYAVTLPEGLTGIEIAARLEQGGFGAAGPFLRLFSDPTPLADLDPQATDLEGYLFPDTYHFPRGVEPKRIVDTMLQHFRDTTGADYASRAAAVGLSLREAVILASMIEKETSIPDERERISGVFHNRLARNMKLECDPTVIYALQRAGRPVGRLTYDDLKFDSPWNTYVVRGLPRGPIANPGRESLFAALRPAAGDELYFVAAPEGGHRFSSDLESHLEAVAVWRRHVRSSR